MTDLAKIRRKAREVAKAAGRPSGSCLKSLAKKHGLKNFKYVEYGDKKKDEQ